MVNMVQKEMQCGEGELTNLAAAFMLLDFSQLQKFLLLRLVESKLHALYAKLERHSGIP